MADTQSRRTWNAVIGAAASGGGVTIVTFASGVVIARLLSPEARGEYGAVLLISQLLVTLLCLSFFDGAMIRLRRSPEQVGVLIPTMLFASLVIFILACVAMLAGLPLVAQRFAILSPTVFAVFCVWLFVLDFLTQFLSAADRSRMLFAFPNVFKLLAPTFFLFGLGVIWLATGGQAGLHIVLAAFLLSKVPALALWLGRYRKSLFGPLRMDFLRAAAGTGLRLHAAVALGAISSQIDRLMAVGVWPNDLLGQYFVAYSAVGAGFGMAMSAISIVLLPYFSGVDVDRRADRVTFVVRKTVIISLGLVVLGLLALPFLIPFFFGSAYMVAGELAIPLLIAMAIQPIRAVFLEVGRSRGEAWPAIELSLVSMVVMVSGYLATGFDGPVDLIAIFGLANLLSTVVGGLRLLKKGDIYLDARLVPTWSDVQWMLSMARRNSSK